MAGRALAHLTPKQQKAQHQAKQAARDDAARQTLSSSLPSQYLGQIKHPAHFLSNLQKGKGPAIGRLGMLQAGGRELGYYDVQDPYKKHLQGELEAGAPVDLQHGERPTEDAYGQYVRQHLGQSLSPEEEAAIRTPERQAVEGGAQTAFRNESSREAAAGIDPRSGIAADRAAQIERARSSGLSDVERDVVGAKLQRQREFEGEAAGQAGLEEGGRQFDTSARLRRLGDVEQSMAGLAGLQERQRESDVSYTESQRQAALARAAAAKAGKALEPSGLETATGIVGGVFGGLKGQ